MLLQANESSWWHREQIRNIVNKSKVTHILLDPRGVCGMRHKPVIKNYSICYQVSYHYRKWLPFFIHITMANALATFFFHRSSSSFDNFHLTFGCCCWCWLTVKQVTLVKVIWHLFSVIHLCKLNFNPFFAYYTQHTGYVTVARLVLSLPVQFCCCQHLLNLCISVKSLSDISWPWHHFVHVIINQMEKEILRKFIPQFLCAFNLRNVTRLDLIVIKLILNVISWYVYVLWLWLICIFRLFGNDIISINNYLKLPCLNDLQCK